MYFVHEVFYFLSLEVLMQFLPTCLMILNSPHHQTLFSTDERSCRSISQSRQHQHRSTKSQRHNSHPAIQKPLSTLSRKGSHTWSRRSRRGRISARAVSRTITPINSTKIGAEHERIVLSHYIRSFSEYTSGTWLQVEIKLTLVFFWGAVYEFTIVGWADEGVVCALDTVSAG